MRAEPTQKRLGFGARSKGNTPNRLALAIQPRRFLYRPPFTICELIDYPFTPIGSEAMLQ
jgi:hypothetical protein